MIEISLARGGAQARARLVSIEPAGGVQFALVRGGIAFVLQIACVDEANPPWFVIRSPSRIGVHTALGASFWRWVRYLSVEGIALAAVARGHALFGNGHGSGHATVYSAQGTVDPTMFVKMRFTLARRSAPLAAQAVKGAGCERRGNACAALSVGSGAS